MKKIVPFISFVLLMMQAGAQITSVKKLKDIKSDDNYYEAVKNLVEKYQVLGKEEVQQGYLYLPAKPLTHRSFAIVMVSALDKVMDRFDKPLKSKELSKDSLVRVFTKKYLKGYADSAVKDLDGYAQYKDVNNDDPDYASIKKLTNFYRIKLGDTYNTFSPERPMTEKEISKIFGDYFGMRSIVTRVTPSNITRGKWAICLNALMERLTETANDMITSQ
jgi:hypothetical protein